MNLMLDQTYFSFYLSFLVLQLYFNSPKFPLSYADVMYAKKMQDCLKIRQSSHAVQSFKSVQNIC